MTGFYSKVLHKVEKDYDAEQELCSLVISLLPRVPNMNYVLW